jgi:cyclohexanone monooxygenase
MTSQTVTSSGRGELGFDPDALRRKYAAEREKRVRDDGIKQYREPVGDFAYYVEDPYIDQAIDRPALTDEVDVIIVGGGFGGLVAAAELRKSGAVERIRVVEKGGDFGGTWYWNRYPGVQCDIESYIYLPLLEELGYVPKEKYSFGPEILEHARAIGRHYRLYDDACFQTEVTGVEWEASTSQWLVSTNRGDQMRSRFVIIASGPFNRPKLPGIEGIETFRGHTFHTSRWDYAYTGGSSDGGLEGLRGKRVGIIGTGATAVQCVSHIAETAEHLYVFQRTPSVVDARNNLPTDPAWAASLAPGWQRHRMRNFTIVVTGGHEAEDLVDDGWTEITRMDALLSRDGGADSVDFTRSSELADFAKMEQIRARIEELVDDKATAEALKPYYRIFCKRPLFHDEYLSMFNRANVTLVDTDGKGVDRVVETGVIVGETLYEVDCLIFATGFEVGTLYTRRMGFDIIGEGGLRLSEKWADGMKTFHGFLSAGFPNLFHVGVTQTGVVFNYTHTVVEQCEHIAYLIGCTPERIEPTQQAEDEWVATIHELAPNNQQFLLDCTPGYYNGEGRPENPHNLQAGQYGRGPEAFFQLLREWREEGSHSGLRIS